MKYSNGYYVAEKAELAKLGLFELAVYCSDPVMRNMTDEEIKAEFEKTNDYDANEVYLNVFADGYCIQFHYDLYGLETTTNLYSGIIDKQYSKPNYVLLTLIYDVVFDYFIDKHIEMINEKFYKDAEQKILANILERLKQNVI